MTDIIDRIEPLVSSTVAALGLDLEALELTPSGNRRKLLVAVDQDGGVGIDEITAATRELSAALDADDAMGEQPYTLEVTSRGISRPLTLPRHWRRNADRLVRVRLTDETVAEGRIGASDDTGVDLVTKKDTRRIAYDDITSAVVQAELTKERSDRSGKDG